MHWHVTATLGWNPAITGDSFLITYWKNGTSNYNTLTKNRNISTTTITELQLGTNYNWTVQTNCLNSQQISDPGQFTTVINALACHCNIRMESCNYG